LSKQNIFQHIKLNIPNFDQYTINEFI